MQKSKKQYKSDNIELTGILAEFREALKIEKEAVENRGQSSTLLYSGRPIDHNGVDFWYRFHVEYCPALPADTPCKLIIGSESYNVTVVSFEEDTIIVSSQNLLPDTLGKARLENGSTVLIENLIECIEVNADKVNNIGNCMLPVNGELRAVQKIFSYNNLSLHSFTENQKKAIESALTNNITYIWGPPGTGKTKVIGQIISELYQRHRSVLVLSHTNAAVDGALSKAVEAYEKLDVKCDTYPILRIGLPTKNLREDVLLKSHVTKLGCELVKQESELENYENQLKKQLNDNVLLIAKDVWVKENKLRQIQDSVKKIAEHESQIQEIQRNIDEIDNKMKAEKRIHPEYSRYLVLAKAVKAKNMECNSISEQIIDMNNLLEKLSFDIQTALDEVKKHNKYAKLREEESKYMSVSFIQNELLKIEKEISLTKAEITELQFKRNKSQQIILDYEKKNSLARLFAGKTLFVQAQMDLQDIETHLPQVEESLQTLKSLEKEYKRQINELHLIHKQIRAVIPSETSEYWELKVENLQNKFSETKTIISDLSKQKNELFRELDTLTQQQNFAKISFDEISEWGRKRRCKEHDLKKQQSLLLSENERCTQYFEQEYTLYSSFFTSFTDCKYTLYNQLSGLLDKIKTELNDVNMQEVEFLKNYIEKELLEVSEQLTVLKKKMQELEKLAIFNAKIVGTTLTTSYLNQILRECSFDTVILDEASMASVPALWCASYLAEKNIVIVGDFLQLPPIVMSKEKVAVKWLGIDIFSHNDMHELAKSKTTCPNNFIMLNDQFRMEPDIAEIANLYYNQYGGLSSDKMNREEERKGFYDWYPGMKTKNNVHLIDTESLHAWVTGVPQGKGHSRLNCFSAAVDVDFAFKLIESKLNQLDSAFAKPVEEPIVLIIAPYKPHVARINQLITLEYQNRGFKENLNHIKAGTIHSFQGSEADIVIFDLVIDEPHWRANLFLTDDDVNNNLRKMFNVAITRAKYKLFIVGNFSYCQKRAKNNALSDLLDKLLNKNKLAKIDAKEILPNLIFEPKNVFTTDGVLNAKHLICLENTFYEYFMADIKSFEKRMIIYSPFITENRLYDLLPAFADAINAGKQITVVTKSLNERGKREVVQYQKCEKQLKDIGINILHKKGMHEKLIFLDSKAVWSGSLNALSFTGLTGEIMHRHEDDKIVAEYEKLYDIKHIHETVEKRQEICPLCGQELYVKESATGGIYWFCDFDEYSRNCEQPYPEDGILRCQCGAPYIFSMKGTPRWMCSSNSKHKQVFVRECDLKLEKMVALIPDTKIEDVKAYFENKKKNYAVSPKRKSYEKHDVQKQPFTTEESLSQTLIKENSPAQMELFVFDH